MDTKKPTKTIKKTTSLKEMIANVKQDNLEFKEESNFEETITEMILKVSPHGTSYYVKQKIQKPQKETPKKEKK